MKLLHTADWHAGRTLARRSRLDETRDALDEVVAIAEREAVDVVLVCGDVFEHQAPSAEAEEIVYRALLRFEALGIPVVVIPGNHDHPSRWRALEPLLARCAVHVVPEVRRPEHGGIVELPARDGSTSVQIAALPWVYERRLVGVRELMGLAEKPVQTYAEAMRDLLDALCAPLDPDTCNVLAAHLFVSGALLGGGERGLTIGQLYAITPQAIPQVQYAALGHVHRPQAVSATTIPARYAGSILQLDFGEREQRKSVTVVELEPGMPADVREVPITTGRVLRDVEGTMAELERQAGTAETDYLRVTLHCEGPQPGLADQVREILPNALEVRLEYPRADGGSRVGLRRLSAREQYLRYYEHRYQAPPDESMLDLFDELLDEVSQ